MIQDPVHQEAELLLERFGTAVTNMMAQMQKGNWVDDMGHKVTMNRAMLALIPIVFDTIEHRATNALTEQFPLKEQKL